MNAAVYQSVNVGQEPVNQSARPAEVYNSTNIGREPLLHRGGGAYQTQSIGQGPEQVVTLHHLSRGWGVRLLPTYDEDVYPQRETEVYQTLNLLHGCDSASVEVPVVSPAVKTGGSAYRSWYQSIAFQLQEKQSGSWVVYSVVAKLPNTHVGGTQQGFSDQSIAAPVEQLYLWYAILDGLTSSADLSVSVADGNYVARNPYEGPEVPPRNTPQWMVIGAGAYKRPTSDLNFQSLTTPDVDPIGLRRVGVTDSTQCAFYWGRKILVLNGTIDEPAGQLAGAGWMV